MWIKFKKEFVKLSTVYCQNCRTANALSETHCQMCGNRLLLVVFPNSLQYDTNHVPTFYEDHLLERVTSLEIKLSQALDKLETAYDLIAQCVKISKRERLRLNAFLDTIEELNPEISSAISKRSREIYRNLKEKQTIKGRLDKIIHEIQKHHDNPNTELLSNLVIKGIELLNEKEEKEAFQMLERAALLSPKNVALLVFIAAELFRADKFSKAKTYLVKASEFAPANPKIALLLGAILADEGELIEAKRRLNVIVRREPISKAANYTWAMMAASEANWAEAVATFRQVQNSESTAEIQFLLGCAYFQLKRDKIAARYMQKAVELDPKYSDAFFMQSVIFSNSNDFQNAETARQKAVESRENGAQCLEFLAKEKKTEIENALPFDHFEKNHAKILTGGSLRLARFFKKIILKSIE